MCFFALNIRNISNNKTNKGGFMKEQSPDRIRQLVREHYGKVARGNTCGCSAGAESGCCAPSSQISESMGKALGYSEAELSAVEGANMNLGCGNPVAIGKLQPGETVLDLGCGGGFDSFLAAKAVGPEGRVIGVDMTPEMVSKARENAEKMKVTNVSFRLGEIEHLPVADASVDVLLSNCVINLSPDKPQIWREAYRVLRPGGRLAISDVVATAELPERLREQASLLTGCVSGAEHVETLDTQLTEIGFENIDIRIRPKSRELIGEWFPNSGAEQYVASADIEAKKPLSLENEPSTLTKRQRRFTMKPMFKGLDTETQLLIGIGAAVAAGCIPCLEKMVDLADKASIESKKLKAAAIIGHFVKNQPAAHMEVAADRLLGTHLQKAAKTVACPAEVSENEGGKCGCQTDSVAEPCGCS
jgi:SAM-dependent methyltransferase